MFTFFPLWMLTLWTPSDNRVDMITRDRARRTLKERGWSQRRAAKFLGYSWPHFSYVMNGHRESRTLLAAVAAIPHLQETAR